MAKHPELEAEQAYLDRVYARLAAQRAEASAQLYDVLLQGKGTPQSVHEREIVAERTQARMAQLDIGHLPVCFGRIDRDDSPSEQAPPGEHFYIGRLGVWDEHQEPLVVDWRAPVAEPFYRATGRHPMGLARRRHFATEQQRIAAIEDEVFTPGALPQGADVEFVGEGALLAALERDRTGRMHDIVATVQREQDEIIRGPLHGVLVVQGGPGTGKTAVALHRAAYLLYTHRFPLERQGVLVVGPNPLFLRYIDQVLPSLGEAGIGLYTIDGLVRSLPHSYVTHRGRESESVRRVKGDARMAKVIARAVRDRQRALPRDLAIPFGAFTLTLTAEMSADVVAQVRRRGGTHNARRRQVELITLRRLAAVHEAAVERARDAGHAAESYEPDEEDRLNAADAEAARNDDVQRRLRRVPELVAAWDRMWPRLSPEELLHDVFGARPLLALATRGSLEDAEVDLLFRPRSATFEDVAWTSADLALLDEARVHLGPEDGHRHDEDEPRTYGHVVVDEAQDLSPMQLRVLARRSLGSMTVVGDVAQATGHWAPSGWDEVLTHLPSRGADPRIAELTVNYRTPGAIMDVAASVLAEAAPDLRMPRSARPGGRPPSVVRVDDRAALPAAVASEAAAHRNEGGTVAVVCTAADEAVLAEALRNAGVRFATGEEGLDAPIALVPVDSVKGLEFDSVIVVEPESIVRGTQFGLRALFVALTRATKRVVIVHYYALPASLERGLAASVRT
ncbi:MAG TPA: ATP-binding domain-containing protein [Acidimicrobiales bacterium]|nr:ATP-binding domain-containing protein [Acidimicrobiales bacterium]